MVKTLFILVCCFQLSVSGQGFSVINDGCPGCCDNATNAPPAACVPTQIQTLINNVGQATPSPVTICVTNTAAISTISLTLSNYTHLFPSDVAVVLSFGIVTNALMFDRCGGDYPLGPLDFTLEDGNTALPLTAFTTGTYSCNRPGAGGYNVVLFPLTYYISVNTGTMPLGFSEFIGMIPTGEWQVWVNDNVLLDNGYVDGWILTINGGPNYAGPGAQ